MSPLQTFLPLTSLLNLIFSGPTLTPALQIRFPYLELPYCTITKDLAMDFDLSATGQNKCCTQFRNRGHVASWGEGSGGRGYNLGLSHKRGGNFLKYPLPGRGKFFIWLNCLKITDPCLGINNEQSLTCGRWRQGVLCVIQSLPHPDFRCATRFPEWFCVRPSPLFSPSRLPHLKSPLPYPLRKAWYSGYFCTP